MLTRKCGDFQRAFDRCKRPPQLTEQFRTGPQRNLELIKLSSATNVSLVQNLCVSLSIQNKNCVPSINAFTLSEDGKNIILSSS